MNRIFRLLALSFWLLLLPVPGAADPPALPNADDPELEARLDVLAEDLRCVVCQNESLAESRASLAVDLREEIREMMRAGKSDEAIVESLVERYGDFVLYRPPVKPLTLALWIGPAVFLGLGAALALTTIRRGRTPGSEQGPSPEALHRAEELLAAEDAGALAGSTPNRNRRISP